MDKNIQMIYKQKEQSKINNKQNTTNKIKIPK